MVMVNDFFRDCRTSLNKKRLDVVQGVFLFGLMSGVLFLT